ncbi:Hormonally up-regulated neu tumor-associated kinase [Chelonia mydas]|uniref:non-specific serine/threonine protein kinase n=1 Tax=Chelonia mydas TaxID=8469 RepID=M7AK06_CHEMY|nr:Hormonally up-regulated neu tumor-associated kinase [Chelonia mydas]
MIRHPNIAQLLDILETENSYYLVMELCPGGNLMHKIYEKKRLEEYEARKYIRQLILAVEHLHRAGVVHRDLKIENLLLDEDNNIKLIDFGLSNCAGILGYSDPFSTQCGSPAYAAPELLARKKYGPKIDVWSIGVNMYAMLTGTLPFTVEPFSLRALYQKMVDKEMNPFPAQLSTAAINFLQSLLEPDPAKRPNIQQALANRWLNENYPGKAPHNVTYPNRAVRIWFKSLGLSTLPAGSMGSDRSSGGRFIMSSLDAINRPPPFDSGTPPEREAQAESTGEHELSTQRSEDTMVSRSKIHLEDLSQSVLLHMTEKLGYKNSDVINTVLSNRASNTLAIYFLLNKKLERYLTGLRKSDVHDNVCYRNQLYQIEKYKVNQDAYEIQNPKALLKERKSTKTGVPEKDSTGGLSPYHEPMATKTGCVTSCSLEYLEIQPPLPRTPRLLKRQDSPQQESASIRSQTKDAPLILNIVHSFESVDREDQIDQISPSHQYRILSSPVNFSYKSSSERTLSPLLQPGSASPAKTPVHGTQVSFTYEEKTSPLREEVVSPTQPASNNLSNPLGSPNCVKSRGRFPMMGIGQMLRKRNQTMQSTTDKSLEARMPQLQQMNPAQISFNAADAVNGQC